jgi:UDP-2-acetamido-3-amino-2,3-dideoxy-glucuronate N-acetyltransferase
MTRPSNKAEDRPTAPPDRGDEPIMKSLMRAWRARYTDETTGVFVHPQALCDCDLTGNSVGAGTQIWAFAHVGGTIGEDCRISDYVAMEAGATIGNRVKVKPFVVLCDGVTVEDDVFIGPGVMFTNDLQPRAAIERSGDELLKTLVRTGATLSAGVVVAPGVTIGAHAFIGVNALIVRDVPDHGLVFGNPGRLLGWACECGARLPEELVCACGRSYKKEPTGLVRID